MLKRLVMFALAGVVVTSAQGQSKRLELTLDKALDIALSDSPTIKVADLEIERYDYATKESRSALLPALSGTLGYQRAIVQQSMGGLKLGADNTYTGGLSLTVPILAPSIFRNISLSKEQVVASIEKARASKIDLAAEVKKIYYQLLMLDRSLEVLRENQKTVSNTVETVQKNYDSQLTSEYNLITAQVQLDNFKPMIIQTENALNITNMMFKMLLNIPEDVEVVPAESLDQMADMVIKNGEALSSDISGNSELRQLEIQKNILEKQVKLTNSQRLPTLSAYGDAQILGQDIQKIDFGALMGGGTPTPPKHKYQWQNPISVGVMLSVPIFKGRSIDHQVRQLGAVRQQLDIQSLYAERGMSVQVNSAISNMMAAKEKMDATEKTVGQAKKGYSIAQVRYTTGTGTMLELNSSEISMTQAQLNHTQAVYDLLEAKAEYEKIIGKEK